MSDWFDNSAFYPARVSFWGPERGPLDAYCWYSGDVGLTVGGSGVTQWNDRANGNDVTPPVGEPDTTTENGLTAVFYDVANSEYLENAALSPEPASPYTLYAVFRATLQGGLTGADCGSPVAFTNADDSTFVYLDVEHAVDGDGENQSQHELWFRVQSDDSHFLYQEEFAPTANWPFFDPDCSTVNKLRLVCVVVDGASSAFYVDDMVTAKNTGTLGGALVTKIRMGAIDHLVSPFGGTLCEVFVLPGAADATARADMKSYLERWGTF